MTLLELSAVLFLGIYAIPVFFLLFRRRKTVDKSSSASFKKVTVIVAARNEEENIERCINSILHQTYKNFELVIIDDASTDQTATIAERYQNDQRVRIKRLSPSEHPQKKYAIESAVHTCASELIALTDADCTHDPRWLESMVKEFLPGCQMVCGPVKLTGDSLFEKLQALEFAGLIAVTASSIENSVPVMCNGANLVFSRQAFIDTGGYSSNKMIASGDDVFLMRQIDKRFPGSIRFCSDHSAMVSTPASPDLSAFRSQRIRWVSKMKRDLPSRFAMLLGGSVISMNLLLILLAGFSYFSGNLVFLFLTILLGKTFLDGLFMYVSFGRLQQRSLLWLLPIFEILYPLYTLMLLMGSMQGNYYWKNREVRI